MRKFIPNFSGIAKDLTELTKKDVLFIWTTRRQQKFEQIKREITKTLLLRIFDTTKLVWIETDTSDFAIRACLT